MAIGQATACGDPEMIERVHLLKLKAEHATPRGRREIIDRALAVLPAVPGVLGVRAGAPVDPESEKSWDLLIVVRFQSVRDIDSYRVHPEHRRFVDEFLAPRTEVKKGWNFDCVDTGPGGKLDPV
jgi:stress responsive alpha/beta barrel protein